MMDAQNGSKEMQQELAKNSKNKIQKVKIQP